MYPSVHVQRSLLSTPPMSSSQTAPGTQISSLHHSSTGSPVLPLPPVVEPPDPPAPPAELVNVVPSFWAPPTELLLVAVPVVSVAPVVVAELVASLLVSVLPVPVELGPSVPAELAPPVLTAVVLPSFVLVVPPVSLAFDDGSVLPQAPRPRAAARQAET